MIFRILNRVQTAQSSTSISPVPESLSVQPIIHQISLRANLFDEMSHKDHHHHHHHQLRGTVVESSSDDDRDESRRPCYLVLRPRANQEPEESARPLTKLPQRGRKRSRTPVHVEVNNSINDRQTVEDRQGVLSRSSSPSTIIIDHHRPSQKVTPASPPQTQPKHGQIPGFNEWPWPSPWAMPYPYPGYSPMTNTSWSTRTDAEANAVAICAMRGRSHSPHYARKLSHIPPTHEEEEVILAKDRLRKERENEQTKRAVAEYRLEQEEKERREKHIKDDAIKEEHEKRANEEERRQKERKQWEAERAERQRKDEEEKKKREKAIEDEIRERMAKYGFHNREIEGTIAGKKERYCHAHDRPYPCAVCLEASVYVGACVRKSRSGGLAWTRAHQPW